MRAKAIAWLLAFAASSAANAATVTVTKDATAASGCVFVSTLKSSPPYWSRDALTNDLKLRAFELGGDLIVVDRIAYVWSVSVYRCTK